MDDSLKNLSDELDFMYCYIANHTNISPENKEVLMEVLSSAEQAFSFIPDFYEDFNIDNTIHNLIVILSNAGPQFEVKTSYSEDFFEMITGCSVDLLVALFLINIVKEKYPNVQDLFDKLSEREYDNSVKWIYNDNATVVINNYLDDVIQKNMEKLLDIILQLLYDYDKSEMFDIYTILNYWLSFILSPIYSHRVLFNSNTGNGVLTLCKDKDDGWFSNKYSPISIGFSLEGKEKCDGDE